MASAADESAQHNNWPSSLPHVIVANSVRDGGGSSPNKSYLAFNGCTNFGAKITIAIPSTSCSSNAVGLAAGFAGLIYSAALNAEDAGALDPYPDHSRAELVGGDPCPITPNEIKQLLASGTVDGVPQADDVDFAGSPAGSANEPSCSPTPLPDCTSPYGAGERAARPGRRQPAGDRRPGALDELPGAQGLRPVLRLRPREHGPRGAGDRRRSGRPRARRAAARGRHHLAGVVRRDRPARAVDRRRRAGLRARRPVPLPAARRARASTRTTR